MVPREGRPVPEKLYSGSIESYEKKLYRVMERMGVPKKDVNWDCNRHEAFVEFKYKGEFYRFDHSVAKSKARGLNLNYGSDAFAQIVLTLEDLTRMVERGIYDLSTWVAGMKALPPPVQIPECFRALGFTEVPADATEVKERRRALTKTLHPDAGGNSADFQALMIAADQSEAWFTRTGGGNER
jgi:hypothetical protein